MDKRNGVGCCGSGPSITLAFVEGMDSTQGVVRGKGAQQVPRLPPDFLSGFVVSIIPCGFLYRKPHTWPLTGAV